RGTGGSRTSPVPAWSSATETSPRRSTGAARSCAHGAAGRPAESFRRSPARATVSGAGFVPAPLRLEPAAAEHVAETSGNGQIALDLHLPFEPGPAGFDLGGEHPGERGDAQLQGDGGMRRVARADRRSPVVNVDDPGMLAAARGQHVLDLAPECSGLSGLELALHRAEDPAERESG